MLTQHTIFRTSDAEDELSTDTLGKSGTQDTNNVKASDHDLNVVFVATAGQIADVNQSVVGIVQGALESCRSRSTEAANCEVLILF
jgi:hypothetical protein